MVLKVAIVFSGSRPLTNMIEKMCSAVQNLQIVLCEPGDCKITREAAIHTQSEMRVLMPQVQVEVSEDDLELTEADFIIFPGLHLDFKRDTDFVKIVTKLVRKFMTSMLKPSANVLINGSFRGLLTAKIVADYLPSIKGNVHVLDPISFSGGRILGYSKSDGILYSTQNRKLLIHGENVTTGQKNTVQSVIAVTQNKRFHTVEDVMLANAVQFISEEQEEGLEFSGRFAIPEEQDFYEIDDSVPVFLPASKETDTRLKDAVKEVYAEMKEMFSSQ